MLMPNIVVEYLVQFVPIIYASDCNSVLLSICAK
jgi:hypothetical protein